MIHLQMYKMEADNERQWFIRIVRYFWLDNTFHYGISEKMYKRIEINYLVYVPIKAWKYISAFISIFYLVGVSCLTLFYFMFLLKACCREHPLQPTCKPLRISLICRSFGNLRRSFFAPNSSSIVEKEGVLPNTKGNKLDTLLHLCHQKTNGHYLNVLRQ